jgi:hypothetical protein
VVACSYVLRAVADVSERNQTKEAKRRKKGRLSGYFACSEKSIVSYLFLSLFYIRHKSSE